MIEPFRKLDFDMWEIFIRGFRNPTISPPCSMIPQARLTMAGAITRRPSNSSKGRETEDEKERAKIYFEMEKVLYDNYEDAWLWYPTVVMAFNKRVEGFNLEMFIKYGEGFYFSHPLWFNDGKP